MDLEEAKVVGMGLMKETTPIYAKLTAGQDAQLYYGCSVSSVSIHIDDAHDKVWCFRHVEQYQGIWTWLQHEKEGCIRQWVTVGDYWFLPQILNVCNQQSTQTVKLD
jgi:hypothetical protein